MEYEITDELFLKIKNKIYSQMSNAPPQVIEDVFSQTLLRLVMALERTRGGATVDTIAYSVTRYTMLDYIRSKYRGLKLIFSGKLDKMPINKTDKNSDVWLEFFDNFEERLEHTQYDE